MWWFQEVKMVVALWQLGFVPRRPMENIATFGVRLVHN
jgi:hypothetical protein